MKDISIGSIIPFGGYDWRILDIKDHAALIITENIIDQRSYHDAYKEITWADCSLRKYLNGEFFDKFSLADQSRIIPVTNKNPDNQWYGTKGGADTKDSIFILSIEEVVCQYFGDSSSKLHYPGKIKDTGLNGKMKTTASVLQGLRLKKSGLGGGGFGRLVVLP